MKKIIVILITAILVLTLIIPSIIVYSESAADETDVITNTTDGQGADKNDQGVIDPRITWNTFLGGSGVDYSQDIALDNSGNVYVTGRSDVTWGSPVRPHTSDWDAFVAKLDSSGNLIWNTFFGGSDSDGGNSIAVDGSGNVYVTGWSSHTWGLPVRDYSGGYYDAFMTKLDSSGNLIWNSFLGGDRDDIGYGTAIDGSGNVCITGRSGATWGSPVRDFTAWDDAFVAKLDGSGNLIWNTFLGGNIYDRGYGIAVDSSGDVYVTGYSNATWGSPLCDFTSGYNTYDAFAAKLDSSGDLTWNTFLGDSDDDYGRDIVVDSSGNVYITGWSGLTWENYSGVDCDSFVTKFDSNGNLTWNTFLGGDKDDRGYGIALDDSGNIYITGESYATWGSPIRDYTSSPPNPIPFDYDAFAAKLDGNGDLVWNTFLGSGDSDSGWGIALDNTSNVYVTGYSKATWGSPVQPHKYGLDAFVAKLDYARPTTMLTYSPSGPYETGDTITITATFNEPMADSPVIQISISGANTLSATDMTKTNRTHYTYEYTVGYGDGTATVTLSNGTDLVGNPITSAPTSGATFTLSGATFTVEEPQGSSFWIWFAAGGGFILLIIAGVLIGRRMAQSKS